MPMFRCPRCRFGWTLRAGHLCRDCLTRERPVAEEAEPSLRELREKNQERLRREAAARRGGV